MYISQDLKFIAFNFENNVKYFIQNTLKVILVMPRIAFAEKMKTLATFDLSFKCQTIQKASVIFRNGLVIHQKT